MVLLLLIGLHFIVNCDVGDKKKINVKQKLAGGNFTFNNLQP